MSKKGIAAILAVATLTGYMHTLAAQEHADIQQIGKKIPEQNNVLQKLLVETTTPVTAVSENAYKQPTEKLLSELKVYPTF